MKVLEGRPVSLEIDAKTTEERTKLEDTPVLHIIRVGENPDDIAYENAIVRKAKLLDVEVVKRNVLETGDVLKKVEHAIDCEWCHREGMMLMCPKNVRDEFDVPKRHDVEGLNPASDYYAVTPEAVIRILDHYEIPLEGKNVVIVNRSEVVGRPLADMFLDKGATVTVCHSKTKGLKRHTSLADIVVTAIGKAGFFDTPEYFNPNATVVDVGMSKGEDGELWGDVDLSKVTVENYVSWSAVGKVATSILLENVVDLRKEN